MSYSSRSVRYSAVSHVGKVRAVNEDSVLALPDHGVWVVSDGMGGHEGGDFASRVVTDSVATMPASDTPGDTLRTLRSALLSAHDIITEEAERRGTSTIGATVVALIVAESHFACLWAGDSRLYRLRQGELEMLTTDHSVVADLVLAGQMTWDEAENHPQSNAITRAIGVGDVVEIDKIRGETSPGDRFLLCSDGLTKYASSWVLRATLARVPVENVADALLKIALDGGGADNISIIVVDVV